MPPGTTSVRRSKQYSLQGLNLKIAQAFFDDQSPGLCVRLQKHFGGRMPHDSLNITQTAQFSAAMKWKGQTGQPCGRTWLELSFYYNASHYEIIDKQQNWQIYLKLLLAFYQGQPLITYIP